MLSDLPALPALPSAPPEGLAQRLATLSTVELRTQLAQTLEVTATHLVRLAAIWRELDRRGEDLSGLRGGLWGYMSMIADGRLRPELVVRYAGHAMLLRRLAELRPEEQDRLLKHDDVPVVELVDGEWREERRPIGQLRVQQLAQVIANGRIRQPEEQRRAARGLLERGMVTRRGRPSALDRVFDAAQAAPKRRVGAAQFALQLSLTSAEGEALRAQARKQGLPVSRLVYGALRAAGLLDAPPAV